MKSILQALIDNARQKADAIAVESNTTSLDWKQLHKAVVALAKQLPETNHIGLFLDNSPAWIIADLVALKQQICNVPLPTFFSDEQLKYAINNSGIEYVLTDQLERLSKLVTIIQTTTLSIANQNYQLVEISKPADLKNNQKRTNFICKITYTSGTTGAPKGVQLTQSMIEKVTQSLAAAVLADANDRALVLLPLSTLLENIASVYVPILVGATIIVPVPAELGLSGSSQINAQQFSQALHRYQATTIIVPPQLLKLLVGLAKQKLLTDSFRYIAVGGAPAGKALLMDAEALGLPVFQGYGLSEAASVVTVNTITENRLGSVGKPLPNQQVRIDKSGEIFIKGETFPGYLFDKERDPSSELATGDLGYFDADGFLFISGRANNRIITAYGRNISPEWIESELLALNSIAQTVVIGSEQAFLLAIVVPSSIVNSKQQLEILEGSIIEANKKLPDYARLGNFIIADQPFTFINGQTTANGRPNRKVIIDYYSEQIKTIYEKENARLQ